jgi:hypothetical protein
MDGQTPSTPTNSTSQPLTDDIESLVPYDASNDRLSMSPSSRIIIGLMGGLFAGVAGGFLRGFNAATLRFMAENAHRKPSSQKGWYFYHRSKQQYSMVAGMKLAGRTGLVFSLLTGSFFILEDQFDRMRGGEKDVLSSVMAGTVTGGLYSVLRKERWAASGRILTAGFKGGLAVGALQDIVSLMKGRRISYVERVKGLLGVGTS